MKRDLSRINENNIKNIIRWVNLSSFDNKENICPCSSCETCRKIFPKLPKSGICPCNAYGVKYITRVAKRIIKEWNDNGND